MSHKLDLDQPLTPAGRLFLQPETNIIVLSCLGTKEPLRIDAIKAVIADSMLAKHPRLSSVLVVDKNGQEYWRRTEIDLDRHVIIRRDPIEGAADDGDAANIYMADLAVSVPLETDKPLWELHLLTSHKCAVIRVHHALGDGISLLSFLLAMCRHADDPTKMAVMAPGVDPRGNHENETVRDMVWRWLKVVWFTMVFMVDFIARVMWVRDETTVVSGGAGVELWPRKLVTARFLIDDMKTVKKSIPKTTINDVLFGMISFGLSKYIDAHSSKSLHDGLRLTGLAMVNLRPQQGYQELVELMKDKSTGWGNKFGMLLLPTYLYRSGSDPLDYVKRANAMINQKKSSLESFFSYKFGYLVMSILGAKAITLHMISYAGTAYMQILVAKEIVPDPEVLAKCLEDALLEMKEAAIATIKSK